MFEESLYFFLSEMDQLLQKLIMWFVFLMTFYPEGSLSHGGCGLLAGWDGCLPSWCCGKGRDHAGVQEGSTH